MKTLILLAFMLITNVFAGEMQEIFCDDKSLSYCINHFDRQCQAKNYNACYIVGTLYKEQEQYSEAKKYYEMVCSKANSKDSFQVELIDGRIRDKVPAILGMQLSYDILGSFYYDGKGVRQSYEKALQYWKKACDLGFDISCRSVGFAYYNGKGIRQSYEQALQYDKKACDLGYGKSCAFAGIAYDKGKGVKKDLKTAIKFYAKSCDLEYGGGCALLGALYYDGDSVKQNLSNAKELFGRACDFGDQDGCDKYKELKEKGY